MRRLRIGSALICVLACVMSLGATGATGSARGARRLPTLLAYVPGNTLLVRPPWITFDESGLGRLGNYLLGPNIARSQFEHSRWGHIGWLRWGARATGRASFWYGPSQTCSRCQYFRFSITLNAWRVRSGRYTRLQMVYAHSRYRPVFALRRISLRANGLPHGLPALTWCDVAHRRHCYTP